MQQLFGKHLLNIHRELESQVNSDGELTVYDWHNPLSRTSQHHIGEGVIRDLLERRSRHGTD